MTATSTNVNFPRFYTTCNYSKKIGAYSEENTPIEIKNMWLFIGFRLSYIL